MAQDVPMVHLVHPDSDLLLSLYEVLSSSGFQVAASTNALHGLDYVSRSKPRAVLLRWEMSELEASEFIHRAKAASPGTRIILCSRHADGDRYRHALSLGASDLIPEPLRMSAVREAMMRSVGMGVPYEHPGRTGPLNRGSSVRAGGTLEGKE